MVIISLEILKRGLNVMKKKLFSIMLAMFLVMMPTMVHAADFGGTVFGSEDQSMTKTTLNGGTITCPKSADGKFATCYIGIRVTSGTAKSFKVDATLTNMTYDSYEELNGWSMKSPTQSGNNISFEFTNRTGVTSGNTVLVAGITYRVNNNAQECGIRFTNTSSGEEPTSPTCKVENNNYCLDANECTKEKYESECVPQNPQTGNFVPYVVVLMGFGVAGAFYFVTRKKAKIYNV